MDGQDKRLNVTELNRVFGEIQSRTTARASAAFLRYVRTIEQGQVDAANIDLAITLQGLTRHELSDRDLAGYLNAEGKTQLQELVLEHQTRPAFTRESVVALARMLNALRLQGVNEKGWAYDQAEAEEYGSASLR
jgi:hypothetical protein